MNEYRTSYARDLIRERLLEADRGRLARDARIARIAQEAREATGRSRATLSLRPLTSHVGRLVPGRRTRQPCPEAIQPRIQGLGPAR